MAYWQQWPCQGAFLEATRETGVEWPAEAVATMAWRGLTFEWSRIAKRSPGHWAVAWIAMVEARSRCDRRRRLQGSVWPGLAIVLIT